MNITLLVVIRLNGAIAILLLLICTTDSAFPQSTDKSRTNGSDGKPAAALGKIKRYLAYEMLDEALEETKRATMSDEFNAELRLIYGEILYRKKRYEEAIKQLEICRKLD